MNRPPMKILPSISRVSGSPYESRPETRPPHYEVVEGGKVLLVRNLNARCGQKLVAIWRPGIVGTWKTHGSVLIQPEVMRPSGVAKCDSLYTLAVRLPGDVSVAALRVFERGDAYAARDGQAPRFREVPGLAILHAAARTNKSLSGTGFSLVDRAWRYFEVYRSMSLAPARLIARHGPVLLTDSEAANEIFGWREAERLHGGIVTVNAWKYVPESGWRRW